MKHSVRMLASVREEKTPKQIYPAALQFLAEHFKKVVDTDVDPQSAYVTYRNYQDDLRPSHATLFLTGFLFLLTGVSFLMHTPVLFFFSLAFFFFAGSMSFVLLPQSSDKDKKHVRQIGKMWSQILDDISGSELLIHITTSLLNKRENEPNQTTLTRAFRKTQSALVEKLGSTSEITRKKRRALFDVVHSYGVRFGLDLPLWKEYFDVEEYSDQLLRTT